MSRFTGVLIVVAALATGCANHVRFTESVQSERDEVVVDVRYGFSNGGDLLTSPRLEGSLSREETVEWRDVETKRQLEELTPYRGRREFLELPSGLLALPLTLAAKVVDTALLGYVPNELVDPWIGWTFSALNPAMNTESDERLERVELAHDESATAPQREIVRVPLEDRRVQVSINGGAEQELRTNGRAELSVHLLDLLRAAPAAPRRIQLRLDEEATLELFVERDLATRLGRAAAALQLLAGARPAPNELSRLVSMIDELSFPGYSIQLEDEIYKRFGDDEKFIAAFRQNLDRHYDPGRNPESLPASADPGLD